MVALREVPVPDIRVLRLGAGLPELFYATFAVRQVRLSIQERAAALVFAYEVRRGGQRDAITHILSTHLSLGWP